MGSLRGFENSENRNQQIREQALPVGLKQCSHRRNKSGNSPIPLQGWETRSSWRRLDCSPLVVRFGEPEKALCRKVLLCQGRQAVYMLRSPLTGVLFSRTSFMADSKAPSFYSAPNSILYWGGRCDDSRSRQWIWSQGGFLGYVFIRDRPSLILDTLSCPFLCFPPWILLFDVNFQKGVEINYNWH